MVFLSLARGIRRTVACRHLLPPLFLCNLAFSVSLALTFHYTLSSAFGDSRASLSLLTGFDATIVTDLRRMHPTALPGFLQIVGAASLFYVVLNTFLAGGVISAVQSGADRSERYAFLVSCARFFGRFFRLFLLTGSIAAILTALLLVLAGLLMAPLYRAATSETTILLGGALAGGMILGSIFLLVMIADYAKIGIVLCDSPSTTRAFAVSFRFVLRNLGSTLGLQTILLLTTLLLATVHALFWTSQQMDSAPVLIMVFLLHQLFILLRIAIRVFSLGSESTLYETLQRVKGWESLPATPAPDRSSST